MCLILFGYKVSRKYPLILAANRDEFYQRPTARMGFWQDNPSILAGKDLDQGGTWFGVHKNGKFAALTNYRDPASIKQNAPSRGEIIIDFLESSESSETHFNAFKKKADSYNGFNLLFGNKEDLFWFSNLKNRIEKINPGIHGVSNRFLDTSWPKVTSGKKALEQAINENISSESLFPILTDQSIPDDSLLPHTGVGLEWERILSPLFIQNDIYGTRSSTVMLMDKNGHIEITERTYDLKNNSKYSDRQFSITS
ncbi:NRDE family protein [Desulfobacula sp.]|uniref:NRDE family protein n=1 Tax=Desulfobacula sp. TaxID=2593537 RepID=UPI002608C523|nr:NRDE family protein [Desulfobacula sp.]